MLSLHLDHEEVKMDVHFSTIISYLSEQSLSICVDPKVQIFGVEGLLDVQERFNYNFLYTGEYSSLNKLDLDKRTNLLVHSDQRVSDEYLRDQYNNIIVVYNQNEYQALIETIQDEIVKKMMMADFASELMVMVQKGATMQEMLDFGFEKFNNPLLLVDVSFSYLASSGSETINNEPILTDTIHNGSMPENYIHLVQKNSINNLWNHSKPVVFTEKSVKGIFNHDLVVGRIIKNGRVIGYIKLIEKNRFFNALDSELLELLCNYLSIVISETINKYKFTYSLIDDFLTSILIREQAGLPEIDERQRMFGIKLYDNLHVITITANDYQTNAKRLYSLIKVIQDFFKRNTVILYKNRLVVLYDTSKKEIFTPYFISQLSTLLEENNCRASVSLPFTQLKDFYSYYQQTLYCVEISHYFDSSQTIIQYKDIIEDHMLLHFSKVIDLDFLIHPIVKKLMSMDKEKGGNLTETLFNYIKYKQDLRLTAEHMYMHYNTLKYRINRIIELTQIDFSDERTVLLILLSMKILKIQQMH